MVAYSCSDNTHGVTYGDLPEGQEAQNLAKSVPRVDTSLYEEHLGATALPGASLGSVLPGATFIGRPVGHVIPGDAGFNRPPPGMPAAVGVVPGMPAVGVPGVPGVPGGVPLTRN